MIRMAKSVPVNVKRRATCKNLAAHERGPYRTNFGDAIPADLALQGVDCDSRSGVGLSEDRMGQ